MAEQKQEDLVSWGEESKEYKPTIWPSDIYSAVLIKIDDFEAMHGTKKRFIFEATNKEEKAELAYSVYPHVTPKTKAGSLVLALGVKQGEQFAWKALIGREVRLLVKSKEIDGVSRSVIADVMPKPE